MGQRVKVCSCTQRQKRPEVGGAPLIPRSFHWCPKLMCSLLSSLSLFIFIFLTCSNERPFPPPNSKIMYVEMGWILIILFWSKTNHMTLWGVLSHSLWLEVSSYVQPHYDILESGVPVPTMKTQWRCKNHTKEISITILFCFCRPRDWEEGEGALMIKMALSRILILGGM